MKRSERQKNVFFRVCDSSSRLALKRWEQMSRILQQCYRSKYFRSKKILGDWDIRVEQVWLSQFAFRTLSFVVFCLFLHPIETLTLQVAHLRLNVVLRNCFGVFAYIRRLA